MAGSRTLHYRGDAGSCATRGSYRCELRPRILMFRHQSEEKEEVGNAIETVVSAAVSFRLLLVSICGTYCMVNTSHIPSACCHVQIASLLCIILSPRYVHTATYMILCAYFAHAMEMLLLVVPCSYASADAWDRESSSQERITAHAPSIFSHVPS